MPDNSERELIFTEESVKLPDAIRALLDAAEASVPRRDAELVDPYATVKAERDQAVGWYRDFRERMQRAESSLDEALDLLEGVSRALGVRGYYHPVIYWNPTICDFISRHRTVEGEEC